MSDMAKEVASEIMKKYGLAAVGVALLLAVVGALVVWSFAHWASAPGGEVSVLWGLAKYTKQVAGQPGQLEGQQGMGGKRTKDTISAPPNNSSARQPLKLDVWHKVSPTECETATAKLRAERRLREVTTSESGKMVHQIPSGTYFFVATSYMDWDGAVASGRDFAEKLSRASITRYPAYPMYVEIHYPDGGEPNLILYLDEISASRITQLSGADRHSVMASVRSWGAMTSMVSVPVSRVCKSNARSAEVSPNEQAFVLDLVLQ